MAPGSLRIAWPEWAAVAVLTLVTLCLGLIDLGVRSIWNDEGASIAIASQHGEALWRAIGHDGGNLLLYYLVLHLVIAVFGTGTAVLRVPSVLAMTACVPLTFLLGRRLFTPRAALYAAAIVGVSSSAIYWGQMARGYTLAAALALAATLAFVIAIERGGAFVLCCYGFLSIALCYTILLGALVLVAHLVSLAVRPGSRAQLRRLFVTLGAAALACVPLAVLVAARGSGQLSWLARPKASDLKQAAAFLASSTTGAPNSLSTALTEVTFGLWAIALGLLVVDLIRHGRGAKAFAGMLALSWLIIPPVFAYVVTETVQPIFVSRYFLICLPAGALLLGSLFDRLRPAPIGALCCMALLSFRGYQVAGSYGHSVDDFRSATAAVLSASHPGDCIAFYSQDARVDFDYYATHRDAEQLLADGPLPRSVLPDLPWRVRPAIVEQYAVPSPLALRADEVACRRLWVVEAHSGHLTSTATPASRADQRRFNGLSAALSAAYPDRTVQIFPSVSVTRYARPRRDDLMSAILLDGEALASAIRLELKVEIEKLAAVGVIPGLGTILVGDDGPSERYVAMKHADSAEIGIASFHLQLPASATEAEVLEVVRRFNVDPAIDAFLVQLPLPKQINEEQVLLAVDPDKDVDGLHPVNLGRLVMGVDGPLSCTPAGIVELLAAYHVPVEGRHVVVIGRGLTIGRPLALLLALRRPGCNAAVTVVHTGVEDLASYVRTADVVVAAAGHAGLVTPEMVKPGAAVVGAGVSREGRRILSDVEESVAEVAGWITPRIGGVGPMTRAMLLKNTVLAARRRVP